MNDRQRWKFLLPYLLAVACLAGLAWIGWRVVRYPYMGARWSLYPARVVTAVDPAGPAAGQLQLGDRVIAVAGVPAEMARPLFEAEPGDTLEIVVLRDGRELAVEIPLASPAPLEIFARIESVLIALAFWGLGVWVIAYTPPGHDGLLFFFFCMVSAAALATGAISSVGPLWTSKVFGFLLWLLVPAAIHLHIYFPSGAPPARARALVAGTYLAALAGGLVNAAVVISTQELRNLFYAVLLLWLAAGMLAVVFFLVRVYRQASHPERRRQVRLVMLGGIVALAPFAGFSLLPDALRLTPLVPYDISFVFLLAIPLAYGYAILRYRLLHLERYVSQGAVSVIVIALLSGMYLVLDGVVMGLLPQGLAQTPLTRLIIMLLLLGGFVVAQRRLQILVSRFFYGGFYDYRSAVQQMSRVLGESAAGQPLATTLTEGIQRAMQLECACLLLPDGTGGLKASAGPHSVCPGCSARLRPDVAEQVITHLAKGAEAMEASSVRRLLENTELADNEALLLACERARLWIPLVPLRPNPPAQLAGANTPAADLCDPLPTDGKHNGQVLGILILGPRRGGWGFDATDLEVLDVIIRQAGIVFENAGLLDKLWQRTLERERLHRRALLAPEEERKRVARELHDQIIQALVGLNYHLSEMRSAPGSEVGDYIVRLQQEIRPIVGDLRRICSDLRPPALDSLGLVAAIRSRAYDGGAQGEYRINLHVTGDEERDLPEDVELCIFRVFQEALLNVQRHAAARTVDVYLDLGPDAVGLVVADDGRGFDLPERLGQFTADGHFGLIGLSERLELAGGKLHICTQRGQGTRLEAHVPLPPAAPAPGVARTG